MTMQIRASGMNPPERMPATLADRRAPLKALAQALRAGDLAAASESYATLAAKMPERAARNPDGAFARVGAALAAGDIDAARSAFASAFTSHLPERGGEPPAALPAQVGAPMPGGTARLLDVSA